MDKNIAGLKLRETDEYERLVMFFAENGLEFDGDEEVDTDIVRCYKMTDDDDTLIGAAVLALREGRYIIDGIAVDPKYRNLKIGDTMLARAVSDVSELGGDGLYIVARAPDFFRKNGFKAIEPEAAPNFFECRYCPQYNVTCHLEIMKLEIN